MTEREWETWNNPQAMLSYVKDKISTRRLRLFAVACCRRVWHLLTDERSRKAVLVAERFADGEAMAAEMLEAHAALTNRPETGGMSTFVWSLSSPSCDFVRLFRWAFNGERPTYPSAATAASLLREIVGNPFRPVVLPSGPTCEVCDGDGDVGAFNGDGWNGCPSCSTGPNVRGTGKARCPWLTPTVLTIAEGVYAERLPDGTLCPAGLAMLSDALEDAGCPTDVECPKCKGRRELPDPVYLSLCTACLSPETGWGNVGRYATGSVPHPLLAAMRSPGPHYRGFWALDLILGKEVTAW